MRGTRFSMDLDRAPCFEISPSKGNLCASPMRGPQFSMDLDRAPCSEVSPKTVPMRKPLCAVLYAPPMRGTRSLIEINRGPCFETITKRGTLCAVLCAPPVRGHDFTWIQIVHLASKPLGYIGAAGSSLLPHPSLVSLLPPPSISQILCSRLYVL